MRAGRAAPPYRRRPQTTLEGRRKCHHVGRRPRPAPPAAHADAPSSAAATPAPPLAHHTQEQRLLHVRVQH